MSENMEEIMEESLEKFDISMAAPMVFILVSIVQFINRYVEVNKKRATMSAEDVRLKAEIKRLLREAAGLSQPSTFAQAAKLRRIAAAKEKELAKSIETHSKEISMSFVMYTKGLFVLKACTYLMLVLCFWRVPLGFISEELVKPFGYVLSWLSGGDAPNYTTIGIIPWIFVSSKTSRFFLKRVIK
ncbi:PREDICTED: uncharacterized protein LOC109177605 [Ipomoea nil]|uniref:uncharacterized protein LOC109177605 n=1 Tax=Ipomoea nil TaxID=35883 RepID=UPI0009015FA2|nr:PREDICTED: uncharacterized protein LOC109177605 [Ipomoea nil]XP_019182553.1 PREDICTED: uncharacterized protein LOC109177605 [Ipomoea nil]XP_019182554.1 PREDICTED: uncharacterized protein LOC109177605 [Ipomoea nil]XP_019182555.1 PREDICTED: uncharacterized protein LOC109177605 [Ipomoea nil]